MNNNRRTFLRTLGASLPLLTTGSLALGAEVEEESPREWQIFRISKDGFWEEIKWESIREKDDVIALGLVDGKLEFLERWEVVELNKDNSVTISDKIDLLGSFPNTTRPVK
ncbi:hypothetical protein C4577_02140 [Candidatus Parcubacteria bacterium]|nr:MAG: hypothetical protein C4577_02140 [Candidatus Parcubacteria bacterium]